MWFVAVKPRDMSERNILRCYQNGMGSSNRIGPRKLRGKIAAVIALEMSDGPPREQNLMQDIERFRSSRNATGEWVARCRKHFKIAYRFR